MRYVYSILLAYIALNVTGIALATSHSAPARSGEAVFAESCANCHTGGIGGFFSKAPDIDDAEDAAVSGPNMCLPGARVGLLELVDSRSRLTW